VPEKKAVWTLEFFVAEARRLRVAADEAELAFMGFLYEAERHHIFWRGIVRKFEELLRAHSICDPSRYRTYKEAVQLVGQNKLDSVGPAGAQEIGKSRTQEEANELVDELYQFHASNGRFAPSHTAKNIADQIRNRFLGAEKGAKRYLTLMKENEKLRAKVADLESKVVALKQELRNLRKAKRTKNPPEVQAHA
jgi:polyhydroxyalkanoate synthesis regulator phasin